MNNYSSPRVAVIGAGPCGLAIAKNLLQQNISTFTVFEKNSRIGGNWIFDEANDHSSVYETTHLISSKRLSAYEDFPMPSEYPDYPSHRQLLAYFESYAQHFHVLPHIEFNTTVLTVIRQSNQQWQITYRCAGAESTAYFDYLFVANGHHWDPSWPEYPGVFRGDMLHSHAYKRAAPFKDKRVLVVGAGNSACDIAVEVARIAAKTCISVRSGQHIFPKFIFGKPTDVAFSKISWMPFWCQQRVAQRILRMVQGRYTKYHLPTPSSKPLTTHPTINSELLYFIRHGKVLPRGRIHAFDDEYVHFEEGQKEVFDTVIFATGYHIRFPFFAADFLNDEGKTAIPLYLKMLHPLYDNLYFIGLFQPQGCIWPLADHQARIATRLIAGTLKKPTRLNDRIQREQNNTRRCFERSPRHALEVDYHRFRQQLLTFEKQQAKASKMFV